MKHGLTYFAILPLVLIQIDSAQSVAQDFAASRHPAMHLGHKVADTKGEMACSTCKAYTHLTCFCECNSKSRTFTAATDPEAHRSTRVASIAPTYPASPLRLPLQSLGSLLESSRRCSLSCAAPLWRALIWTPKHR